MWTREFMQAQKHVFKIGRSQQLDARIRSYPNGSLMLAGLAVNDHKLAEACVMDDFKLHYSQRTDFGLEYFEGDPASMLARMMTILLHDGFVISSATDPAMTMHAKTLRRHAAEADKVAKLEARADAKTVLARVKADIKAAQVQARAEAASDLKAAQVQARAQAASDLKAAEAILATNKAATLEAEMNIKVVAQPANLLAAASDALPYLTRFLAASIDEYAEGVDAIGVVRDKDSICTQTSFREAFAQYMKDNYSDVKCKISHLDDGALLHAGFTLEDDHFLCKSCMSSARAGCCEAYGGNNRTRKKVIHDMRIIKVIRRCR